MIINIKTQKPEYENVKLSDIFYNEKAKITESLIKETQILDPVLHKVKMWKKHNNKPHSVTMDIRGNKVLFTKGLYFCSAVSEKLARELGPGSAS